MKYCLAYDSKNPDFFDGGSLKMHIVTILSYSYAVNLHNPISTTILFEDVVNESRIDYWNGIIDNNLGDDIYYYLCEVDVFRINGDEELEKEFQSIVHEYERGS